MAPTQPTSLRVLRVVFAAIAFLFVVGNVRSLSSQAFLSSQPAKPVTALAARGGVVKAAKGSGVSPAGAQRWWLSRAHAGAFARAPRRWAVAHRAFFDLNAPGAEAPVLDQDTEDGLPGDGGADGVAVDASLFAGRGPAPPARASELVGWARADAPRAPLEPFCPPIQRPPIA
jgi:hypothetical protein